MGNREGTDLWLLSWILPPRCKLGTLRPVRIETAGLHFRLKPEREIILPTCSAMLV